jgi:hypothetical protein
VDDATATLGADGRPGPRRPLVASATRRARAGNASPLRGVPHRACRPHAGLRAWVPTDTGRGERWNVLGSRPGDPLSLLRGPCSRCSEIGEQPEQHDGRGAGRHDGQAGQESVQPTEDGPRDEPDRESSRAAGDARPVRLPRRDPWRAATALIDTGGVPTGPVRSTESEDLTGCAEGGPRPRDGTADEPLPRSGSRTEILGLAPPRSTDRMTPAGPSSAGRVPARAGPSRGDRRARVPTSAPGTSGRRRARALRAPTHRSRARLPALPHTLRRPPTGDGRARVVRVVPEIHDDLPAAVRPHPDRMPGRPRTPVRGLSATPDKNGGSRVGASIRPARAGSGRAPGRPR